MNNRMKLLNIYIKIHNHYSLTLDELVYLSKYNPDCFAKTCQNLVYHKPETKQVFTATEPKDAVEKSEEEIQQDKIDIVLEHLRSLETENLPIDGISVVTVKNLLGELYMEKLFPHSDQQEYINFDFMKMVTGFDQKA